MDPVIKTSQNSTTAPSIKKVEDLQVSVKLFLTCFSESDISNETHPRVALLHKRVCELYPKPYVERLERLQPIEKGRLSTLQILLTQAATETDCMLELSTKALSVHIQNSENIIAIANAKKPSIEAFKRFLQIDAAGFGLATEIDPLVKRLEIFENTLKPIIEDKLMSQQEQGSKVELLLLELQEDIVPALRGHELFSSLALKYKMAKMMDEAREAYPKSDNVVAIGIGLSRQMGVRKKVESLESLHTFLYEPPLDAESCQILFTRSLEAINLLLKPTDDTIEQGSGVPDCSIM